MVYDPNYQYVNPLNGVFRLTLGVLGGFAGYLAGGFFERRERITDGASNA